MKEVFVLTRIDVEECAHPLQSVRVYANREDAEMQMHEEYLEYLENFEQISHTTSNIERNSAYIGCEIFWDISQLEIK